MRFMFDPRRLTADIPIARLARRGPLVRCSPETPVVEAARKMREAHRGAVIVMENDTPIGIWTERDALLVDPNDASALSAPIRGAMSAPVHAIPADRTWREATATAGKNGVRHLLVTDPDSGEPLGVVSQSDMVRNQGIEAYVQLREARAALRNPPFTVSHADGVGHAAALMAREEQSAVLVQYPDGERGILTERDVLAVLASGGEAAATAGEAASRPLIVTEAGASLLEVRAQLHRLDIRRIGIADEAGTLLGLVSLEDLLLCEQEALFDALSECGDQGAEKEKQPIPVRRGPLDGLDGRIVAQAWEAVMVTDADNRIIRVNAAFSRITGYREEEVLGRTPAVLNAHVHSAEFYDDLWDELLATDGWRGELWSRHKDGTLHLHQLSISVLRDRDGAVTQHVGMFTDLTSLHQRERHYRNIFEHTTVGIAELDLDGTIRVANPVFERMVGWSDEEMVGYPLFDLIHHDDREQCRPLWTALAEGRSERYTREERFITRDDAERWLEATATLVRDDDGRPESVIYVAVDINDRRQREEELERRIAFDHLTGAYNRIKLEHQLETETRKADRVGYDVTLVMFDVDRFKRVNDTLGHDVGDRVLQELVRRVQSRIRETDMLARWGGEEFMLMLPGTDYHGGMQLAETIRREIAETPFPEAGTVTASFGVGIYHSGEPLKPLIKRVDQALYRAKDEGRNRVVGAEEKP